MRYLFMTAAMIVVLGYLAHGEIPATGPAADAASQPTTTDANFEGQRSQIAAILKPGTYENQVMTLIYPRNDLHVNNELGTIPPAAGLQTEFHFFFCTCGKAKVVGHFCVTEYELSDVLTELTRANVDIVSVAPILRSDKPRMSMVFFQNEGAPDWVAKGLKNALRRVGTPND